MKHQSLKRIQLRTILKRFDDHFTSWKERSFVYEFAYKDRMLWTLILEFWGDFFRQFLYKPIYSICEYTIYEFNN